MVPFWNSEKAKQRLELADQKHRERLAAFDRDLREIRTAADTRKLLAKIHEALEAAKAELSRRSYGVDDQHTQSRVADLSSWEDKVRTQRDRFRDRYTQEFERVLTELKKEKEMDELQRQREFDLGGVREKFQLLRARKEAIEKILSEAENERTVEASTRKKLAPLKLELEPRTREIAELKRKIEEPKPPLLARLFGKTDDRDPLRKKLSIAEEELSQAEDKIAALERLSPCREIQANRAIEDAAIKGAPEKEVLPEIRKAADVKVLKEGEEKLSKELAKVQHSLEVAEAALCFAEIGIDISKCELNFDDKAKTSPEWLREVGELATRIANIRWYNEHTDLKLRLDKLKKRAGIALSAPVKPPDPIELPKPATWSNKEPSSNWCPEEIKPHLSYAAQYETKYKHDFALETELLNDWKVLAATRRGKMHAHQGTHREDAFHVEAGSNFFIACVCDGAGSYKYSRIGSETTCREVTRRLKESIEAAKDDLAKLDAQGTGDSLADMINRSVFDTCNFLEDLAKKSGCQKKDFRCTLLLVLLHRIGETNLILSCQVGDGFIAGLDRQGEAQRYGTSDSGEFSGEVNCFIPDESAPKKACDSIKQIKANDLEALIICSDGIEDPFYPVEKKAALIFRQLYLGVQETIEGFAWQPRHDSVIGTVEASKRLEEWLSFEKKGENDDRTILVLHRNPSLVDRSKISVN